MTGKSAENPVKVWRFFEENYPAIGQPPVKGLPGLELSHHLICSHDGLSREKPQQADLRKAAETYPRLRFNFFEPISRAAVVDMARIGEGEPNVDVREKE